VTKTHPNINFVVQNMPGADSVISMNYFMRSASDGYTIALPSHMSTYVTNDIWEKKIKKFEYNSFTDVLTMGKSPLVLVANINSKINTPAEFAKLISTTTRPINVATGGGAHLTAFEYLMTKGNGNRDQVKAIKFNGPLPAVTSVASGAEGGTEFGIMPIAVAKGLIEAGKVKPIGFTGERTMPQFPKVPLLSTIAPGINVYAAWTLTLPPKTPQDIIDWYEREFAAAAMTEEYRQWAYDQVIFVEERELNTVGIQRQMGYLRATFMPVLENIKLED
jgi:tripartite-type tricarboxylate transporter receptor subunit TctC